MSYQEKNITVSLVTHLLIVAYFLVNLFQMFQEGGLVSTRLFRLWAIVIIATIIVNMIGGILTDIVLSIVHAIRTGSAEKERLIADERDRSIELKGVKASYIAFSIGVLLSMLTFVFGQPPLVMFSLLVFFSIAAELMGDISQLYFYRRGF
jgi:hypothetical protein